MSLFTQKILILKDYKHDTYRDYSKETNYLMKKLLNNKRKF